MQFIRDMRTTFTKAEGSRGGFTLVEVMLAVGVIAITLTAMIGLLSSITGNVNQIRYQTKAVSLLANIETTLKMKPFDDVFTWVAPADSPYVIYFWDEYQNPEDPDNSSLMTLNSELPGFKSGMPPDRMNLERSHGEVFRVNLSLYQAALKGERVRIGDSSEYTSGALSGASTEYALNYLPIKVEIFVEPRSDITVGPGTAEINEQRRVYDDIVYKNR